MTSLTNLPAEVLIKIFHQLEVKACLNLAKTCKFTNEVSKIDQIWERKILNDFGINLQKVDYPGPSPWTFYKHILSEYGNFLGLWQATSYGHRGGIFQVSDLVIMIKKVQTFQLAARKSVKFF